MSSKAERPEQWWRHHTPNEDPDPLVVAVDAHDWAVFEASRANPDPAPPVALTLSKSADGRMICTGLIVGLNEAFWMDGDGAPKPVEVTSRALRDIPIAELIGRAVEGHPTSDYQSIRDWLVGRSPQSGELLRRAPGPKGHPDEHFRRVAEAYRTALEVKPRAPIVWLTEEFGVDRSTVTRWVQRARDKGFLAPAIPGKAGEQPAEGDDDES